MSCFGRCWGRSERLRGTDSIRGGACGGLIQQSRAAPRGCAGCFLSRARTDKGPKKGTLEYTCGERGDDFNVETHTDLRVQLTLDVRLLELHLL